MAKLPASLLFACFLTFGAGCLGDSAQDAEATAGVPTPSAEQEETAPAVVPAPVEVPPACPENHSNNYGSQFSIAGHYIVSPAGDDLVVYYQESNGCSGWQTEEAWPHNPDTRIAEVPYPVGLKV